MPLSSVAPVSSSVYGNSCVLGRCHWRVWLASPKAGQLVSDIHQQWTGEMNEMGHCNLCRCWYQPKWLTQDDLLNERLNSKRRVTQAVDCLRHSNNTVDFVTKIRMTAEMHDFIAALNIVIQLMVHKYADIVDVLPDDVTNDVPMKALTVACSSMKTWRELTDRLS